MKIIFHILVLLSLASCTANTTKDINKTTMKKKDIATVYKAAPPKRSIPKYKVKKVSYNIDDTTYMASGFNERVQFIVLHYTAAGRDVSIRALTGPRVSSHYLVTDVPSEPIYQLLPENKRAWHAGVSEFQERSNINDTSIGIEVVNPGYRESGGKRIYTHFKESEILKVGELLRNITSRYDMDPTKIIGHSDIAPDRKQDPGPLFPWKRLYYEYGVGAWYDEDAFNVYYDESYYALISTADIQKLFKRYGYSIIVNGEWDEYNKKVVGAFQKHFRPSLYNGEMDLETFAILMALIKKYNK